MRPARHVAAHERAVQHAREHDVVDVPAVPGQQPRVFAPLHRLPDEPARGRRAHCAPRSRAASLHRADDALVAGAAAQVARQRLADLGFGRAAGSRRAARSPTRRSRACRSRTAARAQSRNASCTGDSAPSGPPSPSIVVTSAPSACTANMQARAHGLAVEQHRARAAHAVLAAEVRARERALLAEEVGERLPRLRRRPAGVRRSPSSQPAARRSSWARATARSTR